jgi:hypothetical protein
MHLNAVDHQAGVTIEVLFNQKPNTEPVIPAIANLKSTPLNIVHNWEAKADVYSADQFDGQDRPDDIAPVASLTTDIVKRRFEANPILTIRFCDQPPTDKLGKFFVVVKITKPDWVELVYEFETQTYEIRL